MLRFIKYSARRLFTFGLIFLNLLLYVNGSFPYYGTKIGALKRLHHGVSGDVYAVDSRTLFIKNFNYDGEAPAAYFYVGNTEKPSNEGGVRLRDERGSTAPLTRRYRNKDITLTLPDGKTLKDIKWFSVWCDEFAVNFGDVSISNNIDFPRPQKINGLNGVHGVKSDNIVIVDAQTLLVPNFSYDGEAPDAKFWVGQGDHPTPNGLRIPDENGKEDPLRRYDRKTIVLTLPDDLTIFDIGHFGVWCEAFTVDFGHILIPKNVNVPPSLKMLGISPQSKLNCEVLYDELAFEVRWAVAGESIVVQLVAKLDNNEYMAFGISSQKNQSIMIGADVVVAWVDQESGKGFAQDYYLDDKSQCSGKRGSCPDVNILENSNSVRLLNAATVNGYSIVTYQRSLNATDKLDLNISISGAEAIVWAIGPLNERKETSFHTQYTKNNHFIDFGRQPTWNCPIPEGSNSDNENDNENEHEDNETVKNTYNKNNEDEESFYTPTIHDAISEEEFYDKRAQALLDKQFQNITNNAQLARDRQVPTPKPVRNDIKPWDIPPIQCYEPDDGVFYAQIGPTGGKHGYTAITGHVGWGISWYINGLLIPEIHVVRGKTYTFVVEGGINPDIPAKYHPFYITDDPIGGYEHRSETEKKNIRIFAGVQRSRSGKMIPTGVGRLCNWTPNLDGPPADDYQSFGAYQRTLTLKCEPGDPGVITWKPDQNTPHIVYYHCFTHRYLGWKIFVHDTCDDMHYAASNKYAISVPAPIISNLEDNKNESTIHYDNKVGSNDSFLLKHETDLIKNHNMNGTPPKINFELTKSTEITKLISDGIRAAEALEESLLKATQPISNSQQHPQQQQQQNTSYMLNNASTTSDLNSSSIFSSTPKRKETNVKFSNINTVPSSQLTSAHFEGDSHFQQFPYNIITASNTQLLSKVPSQSPLLPSSISTPHYHLAHTSHLHKYHHQQQHLPNNHYHNHHLNNNNLTVNNLLQHSQKTISLADFLRPPFNTPLFQLVKLPGRRPPPGPLKKVPASTAILPQQLPRHPSVSIITPKGPLSQASIVVNHYRKPVSPLLRPLIKDKPFSLQSAAVLLLGQPNELKGHRTTESLTQINPKPSIHLPYNDILKQGSLQKPIHHIKTLEKLKKPYQPVKLSHSLTNENTKPINSGLFAVTTVNPKESDVPFDVLKKVFNISETQDNPSLAEIATMKPAINEGFKPDSVIVESGFRPILRDDGPIPPPEVIEQIASRRDDPGSEMDEILNLGSLFLSSPKAAQRHNFEPMFIPSPPDSTNSSITLRYALSQINTNQSQLSSQALIEPHYQKFTSLLKSTNPHDIAKFQNATLEVSIPDNKNYNKSEMDYHDSEEHLTDLLDTFEKETNGGNSIFSLALETQDEKLGNITTSITTTTAITRTVLENVPLTTDKPLLILDKLKNHNSIMLHKDKELSESSEEKDNIYADRQNIENDSTYDDTELNGDYDMETQDSERIHSYYLPPISTNNESSSRKSSSDTIVTFDGKFLKDTSLALPLKQDHKSQLRSFGGFSSLEQLIKTTPQFGPFLGEKPSLNIESVPAKLK